MLLEGKKALITGGARGIGKEIVISFLNNGASVYFIDLNPSDYMNEYETLAAKTGQKVVFKQANVADEEQISSVVNEILAAKGILALATDTNPGTAWCESMQFILALACRKMGLTPAQAIAAGTINAAAALNREDDIGSIEMGKQADLLILSVDDYRHLGYRFGTNLVAYVIKKGRFFRSDSLCPTSFTSPVKRYHDS